MVEVVMVCSWEGNCRSGVTLAMCHRPSGTYTYVLNGPRRGDEHPAYIPTVQQHLYLYLNHGTKAHHQRTILNTVFQLHLD